MRTDRTLPSIVIARDGSSAIELVGFDGANKVPNRSTRGYYYHFRLLDDETVRLLSVQFSNTVLSIKPDNFGLSDSFYRDTDFKLFAEAAIGEYLDEHGAPTKPVDAQQALVIDCFSPQFEAWRARKRSTDDEVIAYIKTRLRWAWRFGRESEEFSSADYLRLRTTPTDFRRITTMFTGDDWEFVEMEMGFATLKPTKRLLAAASGAPTPAASSSTVQSGAPPAVGTAGDVESDESGFVHFVDPTRIGELRSIVSSDFDLRKVIAIGEELNVAYRSQCYLSVAMLTRSLLDHVPPIFGASSFAAVASNYSAPRSFKESMAHLELSARKIADAHLHVQIRNKESLPTKTQIYFANDLDVMLAEIVRILS